MSRLMGFEEAFQAADLAVRTVRSDGLRDIEKVVLEGSWNRCTYQEIAAEAGYTEGYLSRDVGPALWSVLSDALGMQVKKTNFRTAIERWSKAHDDAQQQELSGQNGHIATHPESTIPEPATDGLPLDVSDFRGREQLLAELSKWVVDDLGRLLCLSGIPGVGKTWMAVKLADQVRSHFQRLIYRDLSDCPMPTVLLQDLLARLNVPTSAHLAFSEGLELLLQTLTQQRCLILLDHTDVFYQHDCLGGTYASHFEAYDQVLAVLASRDHQSCVLWVGRELPRAAVPLTGSNCRMEALQGLQAEELAALAFWPEAINASEADWHCLSVRYGGLPALILSEIAPRLTSFSNRLEACLQTLQWDNRVLLPYVEEWLAPLSAAEWLIITYMMISRQPLSLTQLNDYAAMMPLSVIESLCDRGICFASMGDEPQWELSLPDLLVPYLRDRFLNSLQNADEVERIQLLNQYPLVQAKAPEMIRQWQRQNLLEAFAALLEGEMPQLASKQAFLQQAMRTSQQLAQTDTPAGYSAGNLINLAQHWQISLVDLDLQGVSLREADLQSDLCQGVSLAGADLSHALLAKPLGQSPVIAVNPNQAQVAVGDQDGRLLLWDIRDGRLQRTMLNFAEAVRAIAFSPDGMTLAEGREDGTIRLWDLHTEYGSELFATAAGALTRLVFSLDQQLLVGGDDQGKLYVWRLASGEEIHRISAHEAAIVEIALSPCSQRLITCGQDCAAVEWDLQTGQISHRFQGRLTNLLGTVAYLPAATDSGVRSVVVGRDEGQIVIWDIPSARPLRIMGHACDFFMALTLSPNGRYLAASDITNKISVWDVDSRSRLYQICESTAPVEALAFSPDSQELMTGCDYSVQRWRVTTGQCLRVWRSDRHPAVKLALSTQPLQLLSSHDDQTLRCWQFSQKRQRWLPHERLQVPSDDPVSMLATHSQGTYRAVGTETGQIHVWQQAEQVWLPWSMRLTGAITALAFSADGRCLAAGDAAGTVAIWDLPNPVFRWQKTQIHADRVTALAFAPDGQRLFSGSRDRTIQAWDHPGNSLGTFIGHRRRVHTLCVSQDGNTLYSGSYDGTVRRWDLTNHALTDAWEKRDQYVHWVTLDANERPVAIISDTQTIELWELDTDTRRATVSSEEVTVWHISTSSDGAALVCAAQNGEIDIWSLIDGSFQGRIRVDRPYEGMQIGGCQGITDSEREMLYSLGATDY